MAQNLPRRIMCTSDTDNQALPLCSCLFSVAADPVKCSVMPRAILNHTKPGSNIAAENKLDVPINPTLDQANHCLKLVNTGNIKRSEYEENLFDSALFQKKILIMKLNMSAE